jgi:hypothetical protein
MLEAPEWQVPYLQVLAETDPDQRRLKVSRALRAITMRFTCVELGSISAEELEALSEALATLRRLQQKRRSGQGVA